MNARQHCKTFLERLASIGKPATIQEIYEGSGLSSANACQYIYTMKTMGYIKEVGVVRRQVVGRPPKLWAITRRGLAAAKG